LCVPSHHALAQVYPVLYQSAVIVDSSCCLHSPAFGANSGGPSCGAFLRASSVSSLVCTKFLVLYVPGQKVWFSYVLLSALCWVVPSVEPSSKIKSPDENPMMLAELMRATLLMCASVLWNTPVLFGPSSGNIMQQGPWSVKGVRNEICTGRY